jgi:large subunit ribosomal protein L31
LPIFASHFPIERLKIIAMKKGIHPEKYRLVAFRDMSNGHTFLTRSTAASRETVTFEDGKEYPLIKLEISNTSHPFYTGKMKLVDTAGRVDKFMNRYKSHYDKKPKQE